MPIKDQVEYRQAVEELADIDKQLQDLTSQLNADLAKFKESTRKMALDSFENKRMEIAEYVSRGGNTVPMHVPLQEWFRENSEQNPDLVYLGSFKHQVLFVRDQLYRVVSAGVDFTTFDEMGVLFVISYHRSKSVRLPVFSIERPDIGLQLVLRNNFYNWKLSVISETPIEADFSGLFYTTSPVEPSYTGNHLLPVYFEGFPRNLIFGYYAESDKKRWSAEVSGDHDLWMTLFLIMRSLGHIKAFRWHTQESHRIELDRDRERLEKKRAQNKE